MQIQLKNTWNFYFSVFYDKQLVLTLLCEDMERIFLQIKLNVLHGIQALLMHNTVLHVDVFGK
jgi:hypothetical protein